MWVAGLWRHRLCLWGWGPPGSCVPVQPVPRAACHLRTWGLCSDGCGGSRRDPPEVPTAPLFLKFCVGHRSQADGLWRLGEGFRDSQQPLPRGCPAVPWPSAPAEVTGGHRGRGSWTPQPRGGASAAAQASAAASALFGGLAGPRCPAPGEKPGWGSGRPARWEPARPRGRLRSCPQPRPTAAARLAQPCPAGHAGGSAVQPQELSEAPVVLP